MSMRQWTRKPGTLNTAFIPHTRGACPVRTPAISRHGEILMPVHWMLLAFNNVRRLQSTEWRRERVASLRNDALR